jgi:hypothetical protein
VVVQVNQDRRQMNVFGDRSWYKRSDGRWAISEPEPFSLMPVTWNRSFGGKSKGEEDEEITYPLNVAGSGFVASQKAIDKTRLPNFEDPAALISSWQDQPKPCNICPAPKVLTFDYERHVEALKKTPDQTYHVPDSFWNQAIPKYRFPSIRSGDQVSVTGMSEEPLVFLVPSLHLSAAAAIGDKRSVFPLVLDTLLFLPSSSRCVFTWRACLTYEVRPRESRILTLTELAS